MKTITGLVLMYLTVIAVVVYIVMISIENPVAVLTMLVISILFGLFVYVLEYLINKWMGW